MHNTMGALQPRRDPSPNSLDNDAYTEDLMSQ